MNELGYRFGARTQAFLFFLQYFSQRFFDLNDEWEGGKGV